MNEYKEYFKKRNEALTKKQKFKSWARFWGKKSLKPPRGHKANSFWLGLIATVLASGSLWVLLGGEEQAIELLNKVEISFLGEATAAESAKPAASVKEKGEKSAVLDKTKEKSSEAHAATE